MLRVRSLLLALICLATAVVVTHLGYNAVQTASVQTESVQTASAQVASTQSVVMHHCTKPNYVSSSRNAQRGYGSSYVVENNIWEPIKISQTLYSCAHDSFYVRAHVTDKAGAVQSYPSSQYTFGSPVEISKFRSLTSQFGLESPPAGSGLDYEFAYDIWINGYSGRKHTELMIWEFNHGQRPAGSKIGTASLDGATWDVWRSGEAGKGRGNIVTFVNKVRRKSGTTHLLAFFKYAAHKSWLSGGESARLKQVDWGAELCASPKNTIFDFTAFNVKFTR